MRTRHNSPQGILLLIPAGKLPPSDPLSQSRCKLPQRGPERSLGRSCILLHCVLAKRIWLQHSGSLVSITMSGKMKVSPDSGQIWNLLATYASER